ncbi:MAG: hypothetical protein ACLGSH_01805 [Acidobacteriota bacterium]
MSFTVELLPPPSDEALKALYAQHGSVWTVAEMVGLSGQTVHKRLSKIGAIVSMNVFSDADKATLRERYTVHADAGTLDALAKSMARTKQFICRQAGLLGLTNQNRPRVYASTWKYVEEPEAAKIWAKFKKSGLGLGKYCAAKGYDDLGFAKCMRRFFGDEWEHVIEAKAPRTGMYRLGRAFEYRARDALKAAGYFVLRSPASRSPIDLLAIKPGVVLMIQCKRSAALPVGEWNALYDLAISTGAVPLLASMPLSRGIAFSRLIDRKDGSKKRQPLEPWVSA